jgi:uncharacterized protein YrrD
MERKTMQFKENVDVFTYDGEKVGQVDRVVIDPQDGEVTHLVVRKGFLFPEDKVLPVDLVESAEEKRVTLRQDAGDLHKLPRFEEAHYVGLDSDEITRTAYPVESAQPIYWYPPYGTPVGYPPFATPPYPTYIERNIPPGTVPLKEGARVVSVDGKDVGDVEEVFSDNETEKVTHILVAEGILFKRHKLVPMHWIQSVDENQIRLSVKASILKNLPDYAEEED